MATFEQFPDDGRVPATGKQPVLQAVDIHLEEAIISS